MFDLIPEPDGRVAIYYRDGELIGHARDQAHAEDWSSRFEQALRAAAPALWDAGRALWQGMSPESRAYFSQPRTELAELYDQAA